MSTVVSWKADQGTGLLFKLYKPLPRKFTEKDRLWVAKEMIAPVTRKIQLLSELSGKIGTQMPGPNFELPLKEIDQKILELESDPNSKNTSEEISSLSFQKKERLSRFQI